jgi:uncharacterized protein
MSGETDLLQLLRNLTPERNPGEFVFCALDTVEQASALRPLCLFQEQEAITAILPRRQADDMSLPYSVVCTWITLSVHSSLEAVGLTATVSQALARENISCNVVAAYYHDHIFVPIADAERAMNVLLALSDL